MVIFPEPIEADGSDGEQEEPVGIHSAAGKKVSHRMPVLPPVLKFASSLYW